MVNSGKSLVVVSSVERAVAQRVRRELPRYISKDDVGRMVAAAESARDAMLIRACWNTGGRVSEVLALRRCDLDVAGRCARLRNLKQRTSGEKIVFLNAEFVADLVAYCADEGIRGNGYVFPSARRAGPLTRKAAWEIVHRAGLAAGLDVHPHTLRHSNAIHLLRSGIPLSSVQRQLGHASPLTTTIYTQASPDDMRRFIGQVEF